MIGDGAFHSLNDEIDSILNLRKLFGGSHVLALFVFFHLIDCINGELGRSVRAVFSRDDVDAATRFTLGEPLIETGERGRPALSKRRFRLLQLLPYPVQGEALFA
jgi:hypothetical protein